MLGLGSIGMRHARSLAALGHEVTSYDPVIAAAGERLRPREEVIADADTIVIASPTSSHLEDLRQAIGLGKPVFVEKPISHDRIDLVEGLLALARSKGVPVFTGYNLRLHQCVIQAKEWFDNDMIGPVLWASFTCSQFNDKSAYLRDGVIRNWSHEIDLALHLLGPGKVACAAARVTGGNDDIADIVLKHDSGAQSNIHLDYVTRPDVRQFIIVGPETSIIVDLLRRQAWLRHPDGSIIEHFESTDSFDANYMDEMRAFIDRIEGKDVPGATGEDGLAALDICLQARRMAGLE